MKTLKHSWSLSESRNSVAIMGRLAPNFGQPMYDTRKGGLDTKEF